MYECLVCFSFADHQRTNLVDDGEMVDDGVLNGHFRETFLEFIQTL